MAVTDSCSENTAEQNKGNHIRTTACSSSFESGAAGAAKSALGTTTLRFEGHILIRSGESVVFLLMF